MRQGRYSSRRLVQNSNVSYSLLLNSFISRHFCIFGRCLLLKHAANINNPHGVTAEQLKMHSVALNIGNVSIGNVIAPTTQSGAINIAQYVVNITFYDSESNTTKTLHLLAIDKESAGDFAIGVNDGAL